MLGARGLCYLGWARMTVYVDEAAIGAAVHNHITGRTVRGIWYHMFSDRLNPRELHEVAEAIGLRRAYFQRSSYAGGRYVGKINYAHDHYDVTRSKRAEAIRLGAIPVSMSRAVEIWQDKRQHEWAAREATNESEHAAGGH